MGIIRLFMVMVTVATGISENQVENGGSKFCDPPCQNGTICTRSNDTSLCVCPEGFQGSYCEEETVKCDNQTCHQNYSCENDTNGLKENSTDGCLFGGTCLQDTEKNFYCLCPTGISGHQCQQIESVTFHGHGFLKLPPLTELSSLKNEMNITLAFSTSFNDGIIFYSSSKEYAAQYVILEIIQSNLLLKHNLGAEPIILQLPVYDIYNSKVEIIITATETNITLNPDDCFHGNSSISDNLTNCLHDNNPDMAVLETNIVPNSNICFHGNNTCHVTVQQTLRDPIELDGNFLIGGINQFSPFIRSKLHTTKGFVGCFGNLNINGQQLTFQQVNLNSSNISYGCSKADYCNQTVCQNGGRCIDLWDIIYCKCHHGYYGDRCEHQNEAHFKKDSLLHFDGVREIKELSMVMASTTESGVLAYTVGFDSMLLMLDKGKLMLQFFTSSTDRITSVIGSDLTDGNWFSIKLELTSTAYKVYVSGNHSNDMASGTVGGFLTVEMPIYFGKLHNHSIFSKWRQSSISTLDSFEGCIKDLIINGQRKDLSTHVPTKYGNDPPAPKPGCVREDGCHREPCLNGGTCQGSWEGYSCQCLRGFSGQNCSTVEPATFNGGNSHVTILLNRNKFLFGDNGMFELRTRQSTALLMMIEVYHHDNSTFSTIQFRIQEGKVQVLINMTIILIFHMSVSDGKWHKITWQQTQSRLQVDVDGTTMSHLGRLDFYNPNQKPEILVHIGAQSIKDTIYTVNHFHGCIRGMEFNNKLLNFLNGSSESDGVVTTLNDVTTGCHGDDVCKSNPCHQNSYCNDIWNDYTCLCLDGLIGEFCNQSIDDCINNLCSSGSTCLDGHMTYNCACDLGKTGQFCENFVFACDKKPCQEETTDACVDVFPLGYRCHCKSGWTGENCTENIDECLSFPCGNRGKCIDLINHYKCDCLPNYTGVNCDTEVLCMSDSCFNGGTCHPNDHNSSYSCSCLPQYTGKQCQSFNPCFYHQCENEAICIAQNGSHGYTCSCKHGFHGKFCQFTNSCSSQPCQNGGICINSENSFQCICNQYFTGEKCETAINQCNINHCSINGICVNNSSSPISFHCVCNKGFVGALCENQIDICQSVPCKNGVCIENATDLLDFTCDCFDGFYGDLCEFEINDCHTETCLYDGTCIDLVNNFTCICKEGFEGRNCETDYRGCLSNPCHYGAFCVENVNKSYSCKCLDGFTGAFCETNIDDCEHNQCKNGAKCVDFVDKYKCQCLSGFGGEFCSDILSLCSSQPCFNGGFCIPHYQSCNCSVNSELCSSQNPLFKNRDFSNQSSCHDNASFTCSCTSTGFHGNLCEYDVNECDDPDTCKNGGICVNTVGSYLCDCSHTGYQGQHCDLDIDECREMPCYNEGKCQNIPGSFLCDCPIGWSGKTCGENINDCTPFSCQNGGSCYDVINGYICNCSNTGYHGDSCNQLINYCESIPCKNGGRCYNDVHGYKCECYGTGFKGSNCDIDFDKCSSNPCRHNGSCLNGINRFECHCDGTGHTGELCTDDVDECVVSTHGCRNHATCLNTYGSYYCSCDPSFTGRYCETSIQITIQQYQSQDSLNIIIPTVIIIILLTIAGVIGFRYIKSKRKTHGQYKPSEEEGVVSLGIPLEKMLDITTGERLI